MATDSADMSVTNTLTGTTADTVTITANGPHSHGLVVVNHDDTNTIWFRFDGVTAVAEANNTIPVLPVSSSMIRLPNTTNATVVSVVGNGDKYTVGVIPVVGV